MGAWYIGSPMLILVAGLSGIPTLPRSGAKIDGPEPSGSSGISLGICRDIIPDEHHPYGAFQVFNSAFVISTSAGGSKGQ